MNTANITPKEIDTIVDPIVSKYRRRTWWLDVDDARQVGRLAALTALRTFDASVGVELGAFLTRAVSFAIKRHLWTSQVQVSGGTHRPEEQRKGLAGRCVSADAVNAEGEPLVSLHCHGPRQDVALDAARRQAHAEEIVVRIAIEHRVSDGGLLVALGECAEEVATFTGTPAATLRREAARLRRGIAGDLDAMRFQAE